MYGLTDTIIELREQLATERAAHAEELAALLATDVCDVCCGKGDPGTGKPCVCGGTGKASRQADGFRSSISALHRQLDAAEREVERQQSGWSIEIAERHKERDAHAEELRRVEQESVESYFIRQSEWSERTFGPGTRTDVIIAHIRKELDEVLAKPHDLEEWIDLIMLAMDGFWRHGGDPRSILAHLSAKQKKNFSRKWNVPQDGQPVEHVREPSEQAKGGAR